jgi:AraC family transcriptional regulator
LPLDAVKVQIENQLHKRVAVVHHRGSYATLSQAFGRLGTLAGKAGLFESPVAAMVGIYYDHPATTPAAELRSDAGLVVPSGVVLPAGLSEVHLAAGKYARTTHLGPYAQLSDVWERLLNEWLPQSSSRLGSGPRYERYWNTPMNAKPEQLRTDLYVPLAS